MHHCFILITMFGYHLDYITYILFPSPCPLPACLSYHLYCKTIDYANFMVVQHPEEQDDIKTNI